MRVLYSVKQNPEALAEATAEWITTAIERAVSSQGVARVAVSGGNTPKRTFELLAAADRPFRDRIDWARLLLFWVDERCVRPDDPDSNYRMTQEALLSKVPLPESNIARIEGELDPEEAASRYESTMRNRFRLEGAELPRFDLIVLGLGDNGHTASLFPHSAGLEPTMRLAIAVNVEAKNPHRVTLTWPVINHASQVLFQAQGTGKANVIRDVFLGPYKPEELPAQLIRPKSGELHLLLDQAAAARLPRPGENGSGELEMNR